MGVAVMEFTPEAVDFFVQDPSNVSTADVDGVKQRIGG